MQQRLLGATGIQVSAIGLGAWQLANPDWNMHDRQEALRIVQTAVEHGCTLFDTAPVYGAGTSERLLGEALQAVRHRVVICTKFSHVDAAGQRNFEPVNIRPVLEGSLRRLRTDYVDVLLLHNPPPQLLDGASAPQYQELEQLKQEGKVRAYGVSLDWRSELESVIRTTGSSVAEIYFNVFHQEPLPAFQLAQARGVGLIVKVPLDSGWLSGRYRGDSRFNDLRRRWSPAVLARRAALVEQFATLLPSGRSLTHAALQFCLAQPGVSSVIPGARSVQQALDNFAAAASQLPAATIQALMQLWQHQLRDEPLPW